MLKVLLCITQGVQGQYPHTQTNRNRSLGGKLSQPIFQVIKLADLTKLWILLVLEFNSDHWLSKCECFCLLMYKTSKQFT